MEGLKRLQGLRAVGMRTGILWEGPVKKNVRADALQERLEELLVFEILRDGDQTYRHLTLRGLYKYVLAAITDRKTSKPVQQGARYHSTYLTSGNVLAEPQFQQSQEEPFIRTIMENPTPLGQAMLVNAKEHGDNENMSRSPMSPRSRNHRRTHSVNPTMGNVFDVDNNTVQHGAITFRERLGGYLHPRDMRKLVTPFSATNDPDVIVRRHVMLLNFDPLRAIILRDRLLVLVPMGADSLLGDLERKVRGNNDEFFSDFMDVAESSNNTGDPNGLARDLSKTKKNIFNKVFKVGVSSSEDLSSTSQKKFKEKNNFSRQKSGDKLESSPAAPPFDGKNSETQSDIFEDEDDEEWNELQRHEWVDLPFELKCLDGVLQCVTDILSDDTMELQQAVHTYLKRVITPKELRGEDPLAIIRVVKDAVREMTSRVNGFTKSMTRCLDEDEDMALMNLSRLLTHPERFIQPVSPAILEEESDEPELILEAHLQDAMSLSNILDLLQGQIDSASELIDRQLDATRNKILVANMILMVVTVCLTIGALVGSLFGMNLSNNLENAPRVFNIVTYSTLCGSTLLGFLIIYVMVKTGTISM